MLLLQEITIQTCHLQETQAQQEATIILLPQADLLDQVWEVEEVAVHQAVAEEDLVAEEDNHY